MIGPSGLAVTSQIDVDRALFDRDRIQDELLVAVTAQRPAGVQVELPSVPRTLQNPVIHAENEGTGIARQHRSLERASAHRRALVRADIAHRMDPAVGLDEADGSSSHREYFGSRVLQLIQLRDQM